MKTIIALIFLFHTLILFPHVTPSPEGEVPVMITYGARTGCFGSGPCRIEEAEEEVEIPQELSGAAFGWISLNKAGRVVLRIHKPSMDLSTRRLQFGSGYFQVPIDFPLEGSLKGIQAESGNPLYRLPKGRYPVKELKQYYLLTF